MLLRLNGYPPIWAYDELQKLDESAMPQIDDLFGLDERGHSLVTLTQGEAEARRDITLPICYRNSPWALSTAHAIGLGIYRDGGLVQSFDEPQLWQDIGYRVVAGRLREGADVELERSTSSTPDYFAERLTADDAVVVRAFDDETEQDAWVAEAVVENLTRDELECDDLLIVLPNPRTARARATRLSQVLADRDLVSHLVGVQSSTDEMFVRNSVAIAHIHRAKGNEAPMVYVVDAQYATEPFNAVTRRNILFTAMTRSRAWVRVAGWGKGMTHLAHEFKAITAADYHLRFRIPTNGELARMRRLHRDRSEAEVETLDTVQKGVQLMFELLDRGEIELDDLPSELRERLQRLGGG